MPEAAAAEEVVETPPVEEALEAVKPEALEAAPEAKPAEPEKPLDWRDTVADPELQKIAQRFNSPTDLVKAVSDFRKRESTPRLPGKDATDEERAAFNKAFGVPESADDYAFTVPEGRQVTEADRAFQDAFKGVFFGAGLSGVQATALNTAWNEFQGAAEQEVLKADKAFTEAAEATLKQEWGDDFDRNSALGKRAAAEIFDSDLEVASKIEMKDGRFLLDHPVMVKAFASVGREMAEGRLGPTIGADERATLSQQIEDVGKQKFAAINAGNRAAAQKFDAEERQLIEKMQGSGPIVGSEGRGA